MTTRQEWSVRHRGSAHAVIEDEGGREVAAVCPFHDKSSENAHILGAALDLLSSVEWFLGLYGDLGSDRFCPSCGPTECAYNGTCTGCGIYIEGTQPDTEGIDAAREAVQRAKGGTNVNTV